MTAIPSTGKLAGIDYGTVRIGVALCDPDRTIASPHEIYNTKNDAKDRRYFQQLAEHERLVGFILGLPIHLSGAESEKSKAARKFGIWLQEATDLPVQFVDERYTSVIAEQYLQDAHLTKKQRKKRIDALAAQIILTTYLEAPHQTQEPGALE